MHVYCSREYDILSIFSYTVVWHINFVHIYFVAYRIYDIHIWHITYVHIQIVEIRKGDKIDEIVRIRDYHSLVKINVRIYRV